MAALLMTLYPSQLHAGVNTPPPPPIFSTDRNMILGATNRDIGHQIENIVYLELLRRGYLINIGKAGRDAEVDFVAVRDKQTEYYQVSASVLDENTLTRELTSLKQIKDNYPKFLLTLDDFTGDHNGIKQINLIDWLMENRT
jgi:predicted AAA+ superfamily ATPase